MSRNSKIRQERYRIAVLRELLLKRARSLRIQRVGIPIRRSRHRQHTIPTTAHGWHVGRLHCIPSSFLSFPPFSFLFFLFSSLFLLMFAPLFLLFITKIFRTHNMMVEHGMHLLGQGICQQTQIQFLFWVEFWS